MANNLYEEAINAAEQIKQAAENKVKEQLVEAMSPKIKTLIERSLMGEEIDEMSDAAPIEASDDREEDDDEKSKNGQEEPGDDKDDKVEESDDTDECGTMENDENVNEVEISASSAKIIERMISKKRMKEAASNKLNKISESIKSLKKAILIAESTNKSKKYSKKFIKAYKTLLSELKNISNSDIIKSDKTLLREYLKISKELKNMSTRRRSRKNYLNESLEDLLEMNIFEDEDEDTEEDDEELNDASDDEDESDDEEDMGDEEELDLSGMDDEEEMSDDDINWSGSDEELGSLVRDALSGGGASEEGDEDLDLDVAEEGIEEVYEVDEMDDLGEIDEEDQQELAHESRRRGNDLFLEIDENMLKKEITKMRRLREGEASDMASHFGGGKLDKEMFVDVDDGDLNVHAGVLGREDVPMPKVEAALRKTVRKNRMLESKIRQYKNAVRGMKTQLTEMNLFNAKLLYANKLMQNRDLSMKQQRHIVESLDEASTLNEAKLLFESLSKSLSKPSRRRSRNLSEGANRRTLSSASRSTRSAQTLKENVALDRWATLAGIK